MDQYASWLPATKNTSLNRAKPSEQAVINRHANVPKEGERVGVGIGREVELIYVALAIRRWRALDLEVDIAQQLNAHRSSPQWSDSKVLGNKEKWPGKFVRMTGSL